MKCRLLGLLFALFVLSCGTRRHEVTHTSHDNQKVQGDVSVVLPVLKAYHDSIIKVTDVEIGYSTELLSKEKPNSSLGNLFCDAMLYYTELNGITVDAAVSNFGGIRLNSINKGPITIGKIYELSPFENFLSVVELKANDIEQWCRLMAEKGGDPVLGISFSYKKIDETIVVENIKVGDKALDDQRTYFVATNDYLAMGNDGCTFLKNKKSKVYPITIRDCIIQYIKSRQNYSPNTTQSIRKAQ